MSLRLAAAVPLLALVACSDDSSGTGTHGAPCNPDGSCKPGLTCLAGICVAKPDAAPQLDLPQQWPDWGVVPDAPVTEKDSTAPDGPVADKAPAPDVEPPADLEPPKLDTGPPKCQSWSSWSCITGRLPAICWSTCSGAKGAIWCDGNGLCFCTGTSGNCGKVAVDLSTPCNTCKAAQTQGCCN